ncbi:hypothetical protein [Streptomyces scabiei]|uniref:hypothetical protein n=1 Tax=Streptomyces scabiei TaxID=1930 RepID=UPI0015C4F5A3|nr:hypothetical protein [Streptomyces scabiei]
MYPNPGEGTEKWRTLGYGDVRGPHLGRSAGLVEGGLVALRGRGALQVLQVGE